MIFFLWATIKSINDALGKSTEVSVTKYDMYRHTHTKVKSQVS